MDIFDLSLMPTVIERLKLERGSETSIWVYRLKAMASTGGHFFDARMSVFLKQNTDEGLAALRDTPNIVNDLVQVFTRADQPVEVQECVVATFFEMSSKGSGEQIIIHLRI